MTNDLHPVLPGFYMQRCLQLAEAGCGYVAPNPMVGAVLVHKETIIGEGYHQVYGEAHAEVNCLQDAIQNGHLDKFSESALYVSLEPCAHFGKTPPCADLIIKYKIPRVIIGCPDPFKAVNGKGIEKLRAAGVDVEVGVLQKESINLNKRFFTFHTRRRPWIILKWAQTANGKMAGPGNDRLFISGEYTHRLVHKWRSEESSILIGTNTALKDDPELTNRLWPGPSPLRLVVDLNLRLPASLNIFYGIQRTIIFNTIKDEEAGNILYYRLSTENSIVFQIAEALFALNIQSVLVEGGARLLQSFINENLWDEARVITNTGLEIQDGLSSPRIQHQTADHSETIGKDNITYYNNQSLTLSTN